MKKVLSLFLSLVMLTSITAGLTFSAEAATEIKQVSFSGVVTPKPGLNPSYDYSQIGNGFSVGKVGGSELNWFEVTSSYDVLLTSDSKFVAGKKYKVSFVAWANSGYQFANPSSLTSTVDGYKATVSQYNGRDTKVVVLVSYTFTCSYKQITSVTLTSEAFKKGATLTTDFFSVQGEGVNNYCVSTFTRNGEAVAAGTVVTSGNYGANIVLAPQEGYAFADNVNIKLVNTNNAFKVTNKIGLGIIAKSADDLWNVPCTHSYGDWEYDATSHWKACSECGYKTYLDTHDFAKSTVDGNTVYTCNNCGYVKTAKNTVDGFLYADVEGGVQIITYQGSDVNITVPATLNGKKVVSIGDYAFANATNKTSIKSVTLPTSVSSIGRAAFNGCSALTSVNIPAGVKRIEKETFLGCSSLGNITIPYGVNFIGDSAFQNSAISSIVIPCSVTTIGGSAFRGCENLGSVVIPDSVTSLGAAFMACSALKSVVIGNGVSTIEQSTFDGATALESIVLPEGLTSVGKYNFDNKSNFKNIYFRGTEVQWSAVSIATGNTNSATVSYEYAEKFDVGQHKYIVAQNVAPTCVDEGYTLNMCEGCGDAFKTDVKAATGVHTYNSGAVTTEPTCTAKGEKTFLCVNCGDAKTEEVAAAGHTYDAGVVTKHPTFKATGVIKYTCVNGDDSYTATLPKLGGTKVTKVKAAKKKMTVSLKKNTKVDGYQIQYSTSKKFKKGKNTKTVKIKKATTVKKVIKKLKSGKKYYIRVRAFKKIGKKTQYSKWAKYKKAVKIK